MFRRGDRFYVPDDDTDIDTQFRGQHGTVMGVSQHTGGDYLHYEAQFDEVEPPFHPRPYGPKNYWKVNEQSMHPTVNIELTPEGIEAFLNA